MGTAGCWGQEWKQETRFKAVVVLEVRNGGGCGGGGKRMDAGNRFVHDLGAHLSISAGCIPRRIAASEYEY